MSQSVKANTVDGLGPDHRLTPRQKEMLYFVSDQINDQDPPSDRKVFSFRRIAIDLYNDPSKRLIAKQHVEALQAKGYLDRHTAVAEHGGDVGTVLILLQPAKAAMRDRSQAT